MKTRKLLSLLLMLALLAALAVPAFAEEVRTPNEKEYIVEMLGGTPGQINVLLGDGCIEFPDAVPELKNNRTMVPMRAAVEAIGATVDYDAETRTAIVEGDAVSFTHVIGTNLITLGDGSTVQMDVSSYIQQGRTMVPLRFFSQVLGYTVQWDGEYRMVFLLDGDAWAAEIDEKCKNFNAWIETAAPAALPTDANYKFALTLNGTLKDNSESYSFQTNAGGVVGKGGLSAALSGDLGIFAELFSDSLSESLGKDVAISPQFTGELRAGRTLYLHTTLTDALFQAAGAAQKSVWLTADLSELFDELQSATAYDLMPGGTVGQNVFRSLTSGQDNRFFSSWASMDTVKQLTIGLLGDNSVRRSGSDLVIHTDLKSIFGQMIPGYDIYNSGTPGLPSVTLDMTLHADGSFSARTVLSGVSGADALRSASVEFGGTGNTLTFRAEIKLDGGVSFILDGSCTLEPTAELPNTAKPAGDYTLIDLETVADQME